MALFLVSAGSNGEREDLALDEGLAVIGRDGLPSLEPYQSRDEILALLQQVYEYGKPSTQRNWTAHVYAFRGRMQKGNLVADLLKQQAAAFGEVTLGYQHRLDLMAVAARATLSEMSRSAVGPDLINPQQTSSTVTSVEHKSSSTGGLDHG